MDDQDRENLRAEDRRRWLRQIENAAHNALLAGLTDLDVYDAAERGIAAAQASALYPIRHQAA